MRLTLTLLLVSVCLICGCQRTSLPYGGIDKKQQDKQAVQPDPARIDK